VKEQSMQHFPPDRKAERWLDRRAKRSSRAPDEVNTSAEEIDATIDWLAHVAAGRIEVK
jgi:hypothetical protein